MEIYLKFFLVPDDEHLRFDKVITYDWDDEHSEDHYKFLYQDYPNAIEVTKEQHAECCRLHKQEHELYECICNK